MVQMSTWNLQLITDRLQDAALNPGLWSDRLHELSIMVGGVGAVLVSSDHKLSGAPVSQGISEMIEDYYREGWNKKDIRFRGLDLVLRNGVTVDQEFITKEEMRTSPYYNEWLRKFGCQYFAAIGLKLDNAVWCVSIQRSPSQGRFEIDEVRDLKRMVGPLRDAAVLTQAFSGQFIVGMTEALELTQQPAILLTGEGKVLSINNSAAKIAGLSLDVSNHELVINDPQSSINLAKLLKETMSDALVDGEKSGRTWIRDQTGRRIRVRAIALRNWGRYTFHNASMMILLDNPSEFQFGWSKLKEKYRLTSSEMKVLEKLASGCSLVLTAETLNIKHETARSHMRNIFLKMGVNRQAHVLQLIYQDLPTISGWQ